MPMIDVCIPEGALAPATEAALLKDLTDILLRAEGFDPANPVAQSVSVAYLHRPAAIFVGGAPAPEPRYRIVASVPEGQYDDDARRRLVTDVTAAVARVEGRAFGDVASRVWVFPTEVPEGDWGSRGVIRPLPDIHAFIAGEAERPVGAARLARRRRDKARVLLESVLGALAAEPRER
jgi:phenylpyruvate tautomerase PptA (4-oxalocrotonate tautomerase family)